MDWAVSLGGCLPREACVGPGGVACPRGGEVRPGLACPILEHPLPSWLMLQGGCFRILWPGATKDPTDAQNGSVSKERHRHGGDMGKWVTLPGSL